jgi:uncharacterized protein (TIGR00304 family)
MNRYHLLSILFFVLGIVFFALGVLNGEIEIGIALIFPFLIGSGLYAFLGFVLVFIAIMLFMFGFANISGVGSNDLNVEGDDEYQPQKKTSVKGGGVILIGPIPIVFGSNWKIAVIMMILAIISAFTIFFVFEFP